MRRALGFGLLALVVIAALAACAEIPIVCPMGTVARRRVFSGGAETAWCNRPDGVRQGGEIRFYESGAKMIEGAFVDGARFGEWFYYPSESLKPWRRDRWEDGALVATKVELPPRAANEPPGDVLAPTNSMIIKLGSADPTLDRATREAELPIFTVYYDTGKPRVLGHYDRDGLRTRVWQFWYPSGALSREVTYDAGVRHGAFQEWHENGKPKTDGGYEVGERDGKWRRWDEAGKLVSDQNYTRGMVSP